MDFFSKRRLGISLAVLFGLSAIAMAVDVFPPLVNWAAPTTYTPARSSGARALSDISFPVPLIFTDPCRQFDIRPAVLADNTPMAITLTGAPCGIPTSAVAVSVNITVFSISGAGGNGVFKVGTVNPPTTAWINYPPTETQRGNAGIVPVNGSGQIWVEVNQGGGSVQLTVDVNAYASSIPATLTSPFVIVNLTGSGGFAIAGANASTASQAIGVLGEIPSVTPGASSAGVRGINDGTTGFGFGVWGSHASNGSGVVGSSLGTSGPNARGVLGVAFSSSSGAAGVLGDTFASTGTTWGVLGESFSTTGNSAGVRGMDVSSFDPFTGRISGVLGSSQNDTAVFGLSRFTGVAGQLYNTSDNPTQYGLLATTFGTAADTTTGPWGVFSGGNFGATGTKHFVEPDPREPNGVILYSSLEGREVGTYFRGTAHSSGGRAVIEIPEDFRIVTDENGLTVQLTPVGSFSQMYVESQDLNQIVVHSSRDVTFHYLVQGVRRAFKNFSPLARGYEFMPLSADAHMPLYLTEEAKRRLIANGTYNEDGTVNTVTAERAGWVKIWADRQAAAEAAAKKGREAAIKRQPQQ